MTESVRVLIPEEEVNKELRKWQKRSVPISEMRQLR